MQKFNKKLNPAFLGLAMSILFSMSSYAGNEGWKLESGTWRYYRNDRALSSWQQINHRWYFFNKDGSLKTGWLLETDKWYFLDSSTNAEQGVLLSNWQWIDGYCYYFEPSDKGTLGKMHANTVIDGYQLNSSGRWTDENGKEYYEAGKGIITKISSANAAKNTEVLVSNGIKTTGGSGGGSSSGGSNDRSFSHAVNTKSNINQKNETLKQSNAVSDNTAAQSKNDSSNNAADTLNSSKSEGESTSKLKAGIENVTKSSLPDKNNLNNKENEGSAVQPNAQAPEDISPKSSGTQSATSSNAVKSEAPKAPNKELPEKKESDKAQETKEDKAKPQEQDENTKLNKAEKIKDSLITSKNDNVVQYTTESGEIRTILWAKGISAPTMGESGDFTKEVTQSGSNTYIDYKAPFVLGNSWYDANKTKAGGNTDVDKNLCFGAASSNMLHWWLDQNSSYIDSYIAQEGDISRSNRSLSALRSSFNSQQDSGIFNLFKVLFGYNDKGFYSDLLMDLFINGYTPKVNGGTNIENPDMTPDSRGGFFYKVFKENKLTERTYGGNYEDLSAKLKEILGNEGIVGLSHKTFTNNNHIITLWGAEYNSDGKLTAVYISDSDDQNEKPDETDLGMKRFEVRNVGGIAKISTNQSSKSSGSKINYLHVLYLGSELWEKYFN